MDLLDDLDKNLPFLNGGELDVAPLDQEVYFVCFFCQAQFQLTSSTKFNLNWDGLYNKCETTHPPTPGKYISSSKLTIYDW